MSEESQNCQRCPAWKKSAFAKLSDASLAMLSRSKTLASFAAGDSFSKQGEPADTVYCLRGGSAKVTLEEGKPASRSIVRLAAAGDMLGYRCVFSEEKFRASATALSAGQACKMSKNVFLGLIENEPSFSFELLGRMGKEIASAERRHHSFCKKSARERLAEALLLLLEKFGEETAAGPTISLVLSRSEIADWIGVAKETVIRTLTEFKEEGLIRQEERQILILDKRKLTELAGVTG